MIKEYRKISTVKAEQFDGSKEMIDKYNLIDYDILDLGMVKNITRELPLTKDGKVQAYIPTLEGTMHIIQGDYIATGTNGEHWAIKPDVFKKTYKEV